MAVTVASILPKIAALLGLSVGDENVSEAELLGDLNQAYRFDVPDILNTESYRSTASITVTSALSDGDLNDGATSSLFGPVTATTARWVYVATPTTSYPLEIYTDFASFWRDFDPVVQTLAQPQGILFAGSRWSVRPKPNATGFILFQAVLYRTALTVGGSIIKDFEERLLTFMAATYAAYRLGDDDAAARFERLSGQIADKLRASLAGGQIHTPHFHRNF